MVWVGVCHGLYRVCEAKYSVEYVLCKNTRMWCMHEANGVSWSGYGVQVVIIDRD